MRWFVFLSAAVAISILGSSANSADLPSSASPTGRAAARAVAHNWNGAYIGGNIGYSWGKWDSTGFVAGGSVSPKVNGILGGVQIGHNWLNNNRWLLGLEGDIQITGERDSINWTTAATVARGIQAALFVIPGGAASNTWSFPWFGTVRGRLGYAPDNWLLYVTGGLAVGQTKSSLTAPGISLSESTTKWGWTVGGGAEYAFSARWTAKLEYLHVNLGSRIFFSDTIPVETKFRDNIVRLGVNYKF
jgi:outer membrane immunogenic protein